ncbi:MAG: Nif3-like dinuclear metal center hexameric protein [Clostridiales bacterium]|nr:Nif3-like dinuclear metal center hexameric protein [Clostridiales bacterium]
MENSVVRVKDIYDIIDGIAPFASQEAWDNSGLLMGEGSRRVEGIYFALDLTRQAAEDAISQGANLIVTHHPIMFSGRKNLTEADWEGKMLCLLVRNNISVISAHTNLDKAAGGVSERLAQAIGLCDIEPVEGDEDGYLRIGRISPVSLEQFVKHVGTVLDAPIRVYGDMEKTISTVAVAGGSAGEYAFAAKSAGADAYVTGEMRYHDCVNLAQEGMATLQAGHDSSEKIVLGPLMDHVRSELEKRGVKINLISENK